MGKNGSHSMEDFSMDFSGINATMNCLVLPPKSNSHGVLGTVTEKKHFLSYNMPLLELQMSIILIISHLTRFLLKPFGISDFVACVLTGIILGPCGLGKFGFMQDIIFPHSSQDILSTAALFGYSMYIFLAGVQMEPGMVFKIGRKALYIGIVATIVPRMFMTTYRTAVSKEIMSQGDASFYAILVLTSLPAVAYVIDQLNLTNTDVGRLGLASGLVSDLFGVMIYTMRFMWTAKTVDDAMRNLLPRVVFVLALALVFRPGMEWVIRRTPGKKPLSTTFIYAVLALGILSEAYFFIINETRYLGVFLFGLAVPSGTPLGSALVEKFKTFSVGVLIHIMVPTVVMRADFSLIFSNYAIFIRCIGFFIITFNTKMAASVASAMFSNISTKKALALAFILNYTGVVQLSIAMVVRDFQMMNEQVFATATLYILLNATIFPIIIKKLCHRSRNYDDCKGRHVLNLKPRTELKIITCLYGQENVEPYIKLLDDLHPTRENPISVYALHLIELTGRYLPILISHSKHKPVSASTSQDIIYSLYQYEQKYWDSISIQFFTSFSSFPLMHHDIIDIAFEKKTSLIIIPLHRRWSIHGHIESDDKRWRRVNRDVLDKAPCSVAIFFSRGRLGRKRLSDSNPSTLSVCVIFLGGSDDREALVIAKQMLRNPEVTLTIFHCLPKNPEDQDEHSKDHVYDTALLNDIRKMEGIDDRLDFRVYGVEDGPEMAKILHSMANQYNLFIVGRRYNVPTPQTSGLSEWNEIPELGTIGDLLASKDLNTRASVLVVQHESRLAR